MKFSGRPALPIDRWVRVWKRSSLALIAFVVVFPSAASPQIPPASAGKADSNVYDPASFSAELHRLQIAIGKSDAPPRDIQAIRASLPDSWRVNTSDGAYYVSTDPLKSLLECAGCNAAQRQAQLAQAQAWAREVAVQADGYSVSQGFNARPQMDEILRRREFGPARPPSQWDLLKQRINSWIYRTLGKLFQKIGSHPIGAKVLFWLIICIAVGWIALMLVRFWISRGRLDELRSVGAVTPRISSQEWTRAAREAAARGDFREAVHLIYWASVTQLEDAGVLRMDRTRTPREHLQQLSSSQESSTPSTPKQRDSLATLTARLERVWYGRSPASAEDFQACLQQAEELGCRLP